MLGDIDIDDFLQYKQLTDQRIEPYGQYLEKGGLICCNANAADYIDRLFPEYRDDMTDGLPPLGHE